MRNWYKITMMSATAGMSPTMNLSILDTIGGWGVSAADFIAELKNVVRTYNDAGTPVGKIILSINSPGGSVFDAVAMYSALRATKMNIEANVLGIAASAATIVLMAADTIRMPKNTFIMVHSPMNGIMGNAEEMRRMADTLDTIGESIVSTYVARTGRTPEEVAALMVDETWMTADQALANGFCDEVTALLEVKAEYNAKDFSASVQKAFNDAVAMNPVMEATAEELEAARIAEQEEADRLAAEARAEEQAATEALTRAEADRLAAEALATAMNTTHAQSVTAECSALGMGEYVAVMVLDSSLTSMALVKAALAEMVEIRAICDAVKMPEAFAGFATNRTNITDARTALAKARAEQADKSIINGNVLNPDNKTAVLPSAGLNTVAIYAARQPKKE